MRDPFQYQYQEPLAPYTSWRVGGPAERLFTPQNAGMLAQFLRENPDEPLFWLGLGSNLLIRDGGIRGTVIALRQGLSGIETQDGLIYAQAGVPCAKVARAGQRLGADHLGFLAGIPGTVGGALAMNAGAFGAETWDFVQQVEVMDRKGQIHIRLPSAFQIQYRQVTGLEAGAVFLGAWFIIAPAPEGRRVPGYKTHKINELLQKRQSTQPVGLPSGGSVFRNPPQDYAGRLIEAAGLKGYQQGGAQVSPKHANFIINLGNARAWDIESLIYYIQNIIKQRYQIHLEPEVHIVGDYLPEQPRFT